MSAALAQRAWTLVCAQRVAQLTSTGSAMYPAGKGAHMPTFESSIVPIGVALERPTARTRVRNIFVAAPADGRHATNFDATGQVTLALGHTDEALATRFQSLELQCPRVVLRCTPVDPIDEGIDDDEVWETHFGDHPFIKRQASSSSSSPSSPPENQPEPQLSQQSSWELRSLTLLEVFFVHHDGQSIPLPTESVEVLPGMVAASNLWVAKLNADRNLLDPVLEAYGVDPRGGGKGWGKGGSEPFVSQIDATGLYVMKKGKRRSEGWEEIHLPFGPNLTVTRDKDLEDLFRYIQELGHLPFPLD